MISQLFDIPLFYFRISLVLAWVLLNLIPLVNHMVIIVLLVIIVRLKRVSFVLLFVIFRFR